MFGSFASPVAWALVASFGAADVELPCPYAAQLPATGEPGVRRLAFDAGAYEQFAGAGAAAIRMTGFAIPGRLVDLRLEPVHVMAPGARVEIVGPRGSRLVEPRVRAYAGVIEGEASTVFLAVAPNQVNGFVRDGAGRTYVISSGDPMAADRQVTVADTAVLDIAQPLEQWCRVLDRRPPELSLEEPQPVGASGPAVRIADMFVDGDHHFRGLFATAEDAADYLVTLFAAAGFVYRRDVGVAFRLPDGYVRVWEIVPPWGDVGGFGVSQYQAYWYGDQNPLQDLPRAAAHLVSTPASGGVAAGFGGVCSFEAGYAASSTQGFFPVPIEHTSADNWDLFVITHEYGHIFGSTHTFDYVPEIPCEDGSGPDNGTIMGYCHNNGGVINVGMRFHARVQRTIRSFADARACFELVDIQPGDYDHDGDLDAADLAFCDMCANQGFESIGCTETFDLDGDGAVTSCDYAFLEAIVDPMKQPSDCNGNGVPDACEDCNGNGLADECDIAAGTSTDCDGDGVADECQALFDGDCDGNGIDDYCDIVAGAPDADANGVPDGCQGTLAVPAEYPTIQAAIDAAEPGDVVLVAAGTYTGPGNFAIDAGGKIVTVRGGAGAGGVVIDAQGSGRGFIFHSGETSATRLESLTVTNGSASAGAGILCENASSPTLVDVTLDGNGMGTVTGGGLACTEGSAPTLSGCLITANGAGTGAGIYCSQSSPAIDSCTIEGNVAVNEGGGIALVNFSDATITRTTIAANTATAGGGVAGTIGSEPRIDGCTISNNTASQNGGGYYGSTSHPRITDTVLAGNFAGSGGAFYHFISSSALVRSCTMWDNAAGDGASHDAGVFFGAATFTHCIMWGDAAGTRMNLSNYAETYVDHCIVTGGLAGVSTPTPLTLVWGAGNLDADPLLADPAGGDFALTAVSPAVDAGDPALVPDPGETDHGGGPRLADGDGDMLAVIDIGADEFLECPADLDGSGDVGTADLLALLAAWGPNPGHPADLDGDGTVGTSDLLQLLAEWGEC